MKHLVPLFTLEGVPDAEVSTHPITTEDGLGLSMLRFRRGEPGAGPRDVVMIVHGLTTSSDMFIMPEHENLVRHLLDQGYSEVWTLDFRMSNRLPYNRAPHRFTMDEIALYDYPPALAEIRRVVESPRIHVIAHCLGSVSFLMSLFGGAVHDVASVVANSVGLTPRVPRWSQLKLTMAPTFVEWVLGMPYMDAAWREDPVMSRGWLFSRAVSLFHRECDVPACHMLSLMWGTGWPALYNHENLLDVTHRRGGDLYGATGMNYYRHVRKMVRNDHAVKYDPSDERMAALPDDYLANAARITTPVLLTTGDENRVFANSNIVCAERLQRLAPGRHELAVFPGYGHQDVFMGKNVATDVFPRIVEHLKRHSA